MLSLLYSYHGNYLDGSHMTVAAEDTHTTSSLPIIDLFSSFSPKALERWGGNPRNSLPVRTRKHWNDGVATCRGEPFSDTADTASTPPTLRLALVETGAKGSVPPQTAA